MKNRIKELKDFYILWSSADDVYTRSGRNRYLHNFREDNEKI